MGELTPTSRTQVRRLPKRAVYNLEQIESILDEAFVCHVGFVVDGHPFIVPTTYARSGTWLYMHGSAASRMLRGSVSGLEVCVTVTLVDGYVLARSAFHHSMNYRSVVVLGKARLVTDPEEKRAALRCFTNHVVEGRWEEVRQPTEQEMKATGVFAVPISEASAKVRTGPPIDDEEDYALPVWAGVVPIRSVLGEPVADSRNVPGIEPFDPGRLRHRKA